MYEPELVSTTSPSLRHSTATRPPAPELKNPGMAAVLALSCSPLWAFPVSAPAGMSPHPCSDTQLSDGSHRVTSKDSDAPPASSVLRRETVTQPNVVPDASLALQSALAKTPLEA